MMVFECTECDFEGNDKDLAFEHKVKTGHKVSFVEENLGSRRKKL